MPTAALSGGHSRLVPGASSIYGREELLSRDFVARVSKFFRLAGWDVVDCSDNVGTDKTSVWSNCAKNHLRVNSSFDATFHLNSFNGSGNGTEVLYHPSYGNYAKCEAIGKVLSNAFGTKWRGVQSRPDLGWLNTTKTDFYFELLFVDNESDMQKYNQNADKAAKALVEHVTGQKIEDNGGIIVGDNGQKLVVTGGVGFSHLQEVADFLNTMGFGAAIHISGKSEGTFYIRTERSVSGDLDKFTAWLDNRPGGAWWYQYE
ncbi:N-acetylmuramoyl-L-alanine amidase [Bacillus cereus]|uniref:N-acetylmuramoyl-L-alanine amidase n=1 Tax=Bacillus cereus TaxID=1396 RepID=UPI003EE1F36C